ncbi:MAG TPA: hypothetical protein VHZ03_52860 [Trebonia sp.]|nr:hypothetical protein [Trebonia sp.]
MAGPRSRSDKVTCGWDDGGEHRAILLGRPRGPMSAAESHELARLVPARTEMLGLLALGPAFQFRLAGSVAAAWSARGDHHAGRRPELAVALTGRLAPVVAEWPGVDPDLVTAVPLERAEAATLATFGQRSGYKGASSVALRLACLGLGLGMRPRGRGWSPRRGRRAARVAARQGPRAPRTRDKPGRTRRGSHGRRAPPALGDLSLTRLPEAAAASRR